MTGPDAYLLAPRDSSSRALPPGLPAVDWGASSTGSDAYPMAPTSAESSPVAPSRVKPREVQHVHVIDNIEPGVPCVCSPAVVLGGCTAPYKRGAPAISNRKRGVRCVCICAREKAWRLSSVGHLAWLHSPQPQLPIQEFRGSGAGEGFLEVAFVTDLHVPYSLKSG